jgi:hypothetical protein
MIAKVLDWLGFGSHRVKFVAKSGVFSPAGLRPCVGETILRRIRAAADQKVSRGAFGGSLFDVCYVGGGEAHN